MGTSRSSPGAPPGVPLIPPWVEEPSPDWPAEEREPVSPDGAVDPVTDAIAPAARFRAARLALTRFAKDGSESDLRQGLGAYVGRGLGGAGTAARRLSRVPVTAARLDSALASPPDRVRELAIAGASVDELYSALIDAIRPVDGTLDGEASRRAMNEAFSHLLHVHPGVDPLALDDEQRLLVVERFSALEVWNRFELDVGRSVYEHAPNLRVAAERMQEARRFVLETVARAFRSMSQARPTAQMLRHHVDNALRRALDVFQGYFE